MSRSTLYYSFFFSAAVLLRAGDAPQPSNQDRMDGILLRIARLVEWPDSPSQPEFLIGIAGSDPDESTLCLPSHPEGSLPAPIEVRRVASVAEMRRVRIVFLGRSLGSNMKVILHDLRGSGVLTVSSRPGFGEMGGMIELNNRPGDRPLILNADAARRDGFRFHVSLLSVARLARSGILTQ
ncbi:MAG: YfiR family protein [Bryobacterales bacterium]|nr:YfiR family protein [Bryobacterales bacterium]